MSVARSRAPATASSGRSSTHALLEDALIGHGGQPIEAAAAGKAHQQRLCLVVLGVRRDDGHRLAPRRRCAQTRRAGDSGRRARRLECRSPACCPTTSGSYAQGPERALAPATHSASAREAWRSPWSTVATRSLRRLRRAPRPTRRKMHQRDAVGAAGDREDGDGEGSEWGKQRIELFVPDRLGGVFGMRTARGSRTRIRCSQFSGAPTWRAFSRSRGRWGSASTVRRTTSRRRPSGPADRATWRASAGCRRRARCPRNSDSP